MAIAIIIHAAIFSDNPDMLATAGSVSSGVTGVILGYCFNRSRLKRAQDAESRKDSELADISDAVLKSERELSELQLEYDRLSAVLDELTSPQVTNGGEDGEVRRDGNDTQAQT